MIAVASVELVELLSVTLVKVEVLSKLFLAETTIPTKIVEAMLTAALPTWVQFVPLVERKAVKVEPLRMSLR
jgi:hypothetical protein